MVALVAAAGVVAARAVLATRLQLVHRKVQMAARAYQFREVRQQVEAAALLLLAEPEQRLKPETEEQEPHHLFPARLQLMQAGAVVVDLRREELPQEPEAQAVAEMALPHQVVRAIRELQTQAAVLEVVAEAVAPAQQAAPAS